MSALVFALEHVVPTAAGDELADLGPRAIDKRRHEHAAGRAAARRALARLLDRTPSSIAVMRTSSGPRLGAPVPVDAEGGARLPAHVSITHHEGIAVAVAAHEPVGVDLAAAGPVEAAFVAEALVDGELAAWRPYARDDEHALALAFAAKEAASKLLGVGFALPLLGFRVSPVASATGVCGAIVDVMVGTDGCSPGSHRYRCRARRRGSRVLVCLSA